MTNTDSKFQTPQEEFWAGSFGVEYIERNTEEKNLASNISLFSKILSRTQGINSIVEFGSNIGLNLQALLTLLPNASANAIEINSTACQQLQQRLPSVQIINESILNLDPIGKFDLALIKGVLIHINPDALAAVYEKLANASARYVVIAEYYNPSPVTIQYRGADDRLFKRDFAGEFLDAHPDFSLLDYGFAWRRDPNFPQDDITWFLLERVK
ncbi:pseudaminic acid biosynthesis-associated methylase [Novipirellula rosea]|uniref:Pseudaminic acid biosynthesis-associated methylase n=1 Tax=Novipirellula rosea TaxID=1031540 RepID=A0ABP8NS42_9BACT